MMMGCRKYLRNLDFHVHFLRSSDLSPRRPHLVLSYYFPNLLRNSYIIKFVHNVEIKSNIRVEPEYYMPVIPMVLINGVDGIGTGWSSKVPNYNPRDVISNLRRKIEGDNLEPMKPYYAGFTGEVSQYLVPFNFCNE